MHNMIGEDTKSLNNSSSQDMGHRHTSREVHITIKSRVSMVVVGVITRSLLCWICASDTTEHHMVRIFGRLAPNTAVVTEFATSAQE